MDVNTHPKTAGRPRAKAKREAIEILLKAGRTPAFVEEQTRASLTMIYEVRRALIAAGQLPEAAA